ncbi:MAG: hypothetical protein KDH94_01225 [Coxiellaceae bacterium]|nr:hypothetical protein [Coxiellaceae bacterium]
MALSPKTKNKVVEYGFYSILFTAAGLLSQFLAGKITLDVIENGCEQHPEACDQYEDPAKTSLTESAKDTLIAGSIISAMIGGLGSLAIYSMLNAIRARYFNKNATKSERAELLTSTDIQPSFFKSVKQTFNKSNSIFTLASATTVVTAFATICAGISSLFLEETLCPDDYINGRICGNYPHASDDQMGLMDELGHKAAGTLTGSAFGLSLGTGLIIALTMVGFSAYMSRRQDAATAQSKGLAETVTSSAYTGGY